VRAEYNLTPEIKKPFPVKLAIIFLLFSSVIIITGIYYYRYERNRILVEQENSLSAIATLKIRQISQWHSDKLADAALIKDNEPLAGKIKEFLKDENQAGLNKEITLWMKGLNEQYDYNGVALLDTLLKVRLATSLIDPLADDNIRKEVNNVLRSHKIVITDLHKTGIGNAIGMDLLVPLLDPNSKEHKTIGLLILSIDPDKILFPLIQSWPTPSKSSETLILRKEKDSVLYLNELRHRKNTALNLKLPLNMINLLASKAVSGFEGVTEGTDYRNIPVVGAISKIPELNWYMVAKTDKNEILEPFQRYAIITVVVIILLLILNGLVLGYWVWAQYLKTYRIQLNNEITLRKSEELLKKQYYTLKGIIESSGGPIFSLDRNYCYTSFNKSHARSMNLLYGAVIELGKSMFDYPINEEVKINSKKNIERVFSGESIEELEWSGDDPETRKFFEVIHNPILNDQDEIIGVAINARDLTERKKIEEKLHESEELFRNLFENMLNGFAYCKMICEDGKPLDFLYINVNNAFSVLTGLKDVTGKRASEAIPGIQKADPELFERYNRVSSTGVPEEFEIFVESLEMWFAISVYSPKRGYFVAVFDVITARKLADEKLQESKTTMKSIIDNSNSLIYLVDTEGRFILVNQHLQNLLSLSGELLIGQTREAFLPKEIADKHRNNDLVVIKTGKTQVFEEENIEPDGKHFYLTTKFPLFNDKNEIYAVGGLSTDITERKLTENVLRENEKRLREAQEMAHLGFWFWDIKTGNVEWSDEVFKIFCLDPATFKPNIDSILELSPWPEDHKRDKELINKAIESHDSGTYEQKFLRPDKSIGHYYSTFRGNYDENGDLIKIVGTILDITERKKAEDALKESEDKFKYIFDHSVIGKSITKPTGEISVNKAFCEMTGYSPEELMNKKWQDISHPDDIDMTQNVMNSLLSGEKDSVRIIKRYIHKNGNVIWTDVGSALRKDENGNPLYFLTAIIDITDRINAQESLRLKNFVFDDSIAANSISDINGLLTEVNAAFLRIWGYQSKDEVIGKPIASFIKSDADANKIVNALKKNYEWEGDYLALRKDGSTFIAHGLATLVKDEEGKGLAYQSAVIDVTDAKRAEELIHHLNEELEQKVIQRTELLEAANKELEAFSYSVSHDLRAPLRSVHGFTKILLEDYTSCLDEEGKRICGIISSSATQMGDLIDDLLSFSRIGRTSLKPSQLDMKSIVQSVFEELYPDYQNSKIILEIGKLHKANGDANLFKLVWTNLISNAIKYSSKKDVPKISIGSSLKDHKVTYYVKDNGVGFDMKYIHKLFGVFQRLHSADEFEGNGVGLAIIQRIVLKHGGKTWAEGEQGNGATFYFSLPADVEESKILNESN
jgi:PAS domain S-box-containing protein